LFLSIYLLVHQVRTNFIGAGMWPVENNLNVKKNEISEFSHMLLYKKNTPIAIAKGHFVKATKIAEALATGMLIKRHLMGRHTNAAKIIPIIITYQLKHKSKTGTIG
jgi:hypothetical protein